MVQFEDHVPTLASLFSDHNIFPLKLLLKIPASRPTNHAFFILLRCFVDLETDAQVRLVTSGQETNSVMNSAYYLVPLESAKPCARPGDVAL